MVHKFSDLEVIALSVTAEAMNIDSENCLFVRLQSYKTEFPNIISRRQYMLYARKLINYVIKLENVLPMK